MLDLDWLIPWRTEHLKGLFHSQLRVDQTRGMDRLAPSQLEGRLDETAKLIERKVKDQTYRFAPYVQVLNTRGAEKLPREICIPTARDRLVLLQLKERLHEEFPSHVGRILPNSMVRQALEALREADASEDVCLRLDIRNFYGSVQHDRLLARTRPRMRKTEQTLISRAIRNAAVPRGSRRADVPRNGNEKGVPQGLAISNVLADIYLDDLDDTVAAAAEHYFRFVDDILILVKKDRVKAVHDLLTELLEDRGLEVHPLRPRTHKGGIFELGEPIEFLGYVFHDGDVSVRHQSVDRFLDHVAGRLSRFRTERRAKVRLHEWMTPQLATQILIDELNERISGAVSESRRYGWMFYFSSMTDETLLFEMDAAIRSMAPRLSGLGSSINSRLKRLARAYHEVRHRPQGSYIQNYDKLETMKERLEFLVERGQLGPDDFVNEDQVNLLFERYRRQQLSNLEADLAFLS